MSTHMNMQILASTGSGSSMDPIRGGGGSCSSSSGHISVTGPVHGGNYSSFSGNISNLASSSLTSASSSGTGQTHGGNSSSSSGGTGAGGGGGGQLYPLRSRKGSIHIV